MVYCTSCRAELMEEAIFCSKCGVQLIETEDMREANLEDEAVEENIQREEENGVVYIYEEDLEVQKKEKENLNDSTIPLKHKIIGRTILGILFILFVVTLTGHYKTTNSLVSAFHDVVWDVKGLFERRDSNLEKSLSKLSGKADREGWEDVKKMLIDNVYDPKAIKLPPFKEVELGKMSMNNGKIGIGTYSFWITGYNAFGTKTREWMKIGCYYENGKYTYIKIYEDGSWDPF